MKGDDTINHPFEGIFGNNAEVRTLEFMLPLEEIEFNIIELAKEMEVSTDTMTRVVTKFVDWGIFNSVARPEIDSRPFRHTMYSINIQSPLVRALIDFNNEIIAIILNREGVTKYKMARGHRAVVIDEEATLKATQRKMGGIDE